MSFDLFPCHKTISFLHALRAYKSRHSATLSILSNITLLSFSFQKKGLPRQRRWLELGSTSWTYQCIPPSMHQPKAIGDLFSRRSNFSVIVGTSSSTGLLV
ncbi:hypothetical protein HBI24_141030 [Parastagonospora nodorum]|nr:hypothetical protein HBH53_216850 [Parastagonospora nodorum]KAH3998090.1 hypothetical protein HBI10_129440 [Parastagonospora nodorum]KAH4030202.1 hypothetical protein HBI13_038140 [Parastagonospora nodorum]KAH4311578.1 hypothetical protein HBI01_015760 [Parastagonospora nodorum]KAH4316872.1 hypothetical protein HBI02_032090 [Parastagonospora nodorum]